MRMRQCPALESKRRPSCEEVEPLTSDSDLDEFDEYFDSIPAPTRQVTGLMWVSRPVSTKRESFTVLQREPRQAWIYEGSLKSSVRNEAIKYACRAELVISHVWGSAVRNFSMMSLAWYVRVCYKQETHMSIRLVFV
jgi:hypothetical protein